MRVNLSRLRVGMSRAEVRAAVGEPERTGGTSNRQRVPLIWKYGDVELHFNPSGELFQIYREEAESTEADDV